MLELSLGGIPLHLPTKEVEASIKRLISTNLYEQPTSINQFWDPVGHPCDQITPLYPPRWPKAPAIKLNQLYWPVTGASRFAYGYFLSSSAVHSGHRSERSRRID
jgi:hypothetical protein